MTQAKIERLLVWAAEWSLSIHGESVVWDLPGGLANIQFHDGTGAGILRAIEIASGITDDELAEGLPS